MHLFFFFLCKVNSGVIIQQLHVLTYHVLVKVKATSLSFELPHFLLYSLVRQFHTIDSHSFASMHASVT